MADYVVRIPFKTIGNQWINVGAELTFARLILVGRIEEFLVQDTSGPDWFAEIHVKDLVTYCRPWMTMVQGQTSPTPPTSAFGSALSSAGQSAISAHLGLQGVPEPPPQPTLVVVRPRCECGSESIGSPGHSMWCPKAGPPL